MCVCIREKEILFSCVCLRMSERGKDRDLCVECLSVYERNFGVCVYVYVFVQDRERERQRERERERQTDRVCLCV